MKSLKWTDVEDIAIALEEKHPEVDIINLRFTQLWQWVQALSSFDDSPSHCNERILEAIQLHWLEERKPLP